MYPHKGIVDIETVPAPPSSIQCQTNKYICIPVGSLSFSARTTPTIQFRMREGHWGLTPEKMHYIIIKVAQIKTLGMEEAPAVLNTHNTQGSYNYLLEQSLSRHPLCRTQPQDSL